MNRPNPVQGDDFSVRGVRWGFALCALLAILGLSTSGLWTVLGVGALLTVIDRRIGTSGVWRALGGVVPLAPLAGSGVLLAIGLYAVTLVGRAPLVPAWCRPFVLVLTAHLLAGVAIDGYSLGEIWRTEGVSLVPLASWRASSMYGIPALGAMLRCVLLLGLFSTLSADKDARRHLLEGLGWGALVASLVIVATLVAPGTLPLPNDTDLWRHLRRHTGTFTDPNAFGVGAMLIIALLLERGTRGSARRERAGWYGLVLVWCGLACLSGSRAFFLGLGVMLVVWAYGRSRRVCASLLVGGILFLCAAQVIDLSASGLPIGLERVLVALRWDHVAETFFSRTVFWSIGGAVFADNPWFGVGLGSFSRFVEPYSRALGIPLGAWTDNANSYYLGICVELGLVGAVAWISSVRSLAWREGFSSGGWSTAGVVGFLVMCVVGPHLDFDEVTVLFGALLAEAVVVRSRRLPEDRALRYPVGVVGMILIGAIVTQRLSGEWGTYPFERDDIGRFRWSGPRARVELPCVAGGAVLTVRALHPEIGRTPVRVVIQTSLEHREEMLRSVEAHSTTLRCRPEGVPGVVAPGRIYVHLAVNPPLVPAQAFGGGDRRLLGVQLRASDR